MPWSFAPAARRSTLDTAFFPITRADRAPHDRHRRRAAKADPLSRPVRPTEGGVTGGEAGSMKAFLQQAGVSFTVEGSSLAYDGSAIIVTQTARNIERIRNILARYNDVRQVEIESKFMEVQEGALEELGVKWNASRRGVAQVNPTTGAPILDSQRPPEFSRRGKPTRPRTSTARSLAHSRARPTANSLTISSTAASGGPNLTRSHRTSHDPGRRSARLPPPERSPTSPVSSASSTSLPRSVRSRRSKVATS